MKTGTAIALAIGVPATIGIIAWAVLANRIVDMADKPLGGTSPLLPPSVSILEQNGQRAIAIGNRRALYDFVATQVANGTIKGTSNAGFVAEQMRAALPGADTAVGVVLTETGDDDEWSDVYAGLSQMTVYEALAKAQKALA